MSMLLYILIEGLMSRNLVLVWPWYSAWTIRKWKSCKQKDRSKFVRYDDSYTVFVVWLIQNYDLVVNLKVSQIELGDMSSIPVVCWHSVPPVSHFAWHWNRRWTDMRAFKVLCSLFLFRKSSVVMTQANSRRSRADRFNSLHQLQTLIVLEQRSTWRSWSRAIGQDDDSHCCSESHLGLGQPVGPVRVGCEIRLLRVTARLLGWLAAALVGPRAPDLSLSWLLRGGGVPLNFGPPACSVWDL